jgi:hypothetical protein
MRRVAILLLALAPAVVQAQGAAPPPAFADPGAPPQPGAGGCYGCSYSGDRWGGGWGYPPAPTFRRPAPPPRIQGQWRNGWWYY